MVRRILGRFAAERFMVGGKGVEGVVTLRECVRAVTPCTSTRFREAVAEEAIRCLHNSRVSGPWRGGDLCS